MTRDQFITEIESFVLIMISELIVLDHLSDMDIREVIRKKVERQMVRIYKELQEDGREIEDD